jgi:hypothetical protein
MLGAFHRDEITAETVEAWAEALENRDDVALETPSVEEAIHPALDG